MIIEKNYGMIIISIIIMCITHTSFLFRLAAKLITKKILCKSFAKFMELFP